MLFALGALFGLLIGSALNAMVWRLHEGKSWTRGRSQCTSCGETLTARDLVPVASWLLLRGKCRHCGKGISPQYPLVELLTALLFGLSFEAALGGAVLSLGIWPAAAAVGLVFWLVLLSMLLVMAVYDARWMLLPNRVMFPAIGLALVFVLARAGMAGTEIVWLASGAALAAATVFLGVMTLRREWPEWTTGLWLVLLGLVSGLLWRIGDPMVFGPLLAAFASALAFYAIVEGSRGRAMGEGDVKLAFLMGLILGLQSTLVALVLAFDVAAVFGVTLLLLRRKGKRSVIPFGPFLVAGTVIAYLYGPAIIDWYLGLSGA